MAIPDFQKQVLSAVHQLRVDPFDMTTLMMLADLIDEHGAPGAENRTTRFLREGLMVLNTLDRKLVNVLADRSLYIKEQRGRHTGEDMTCVAAILNEKGWCNCQPIHYKNLWTLGWRHRGLFPHHESLLLEVDQVRNDRIDAGLWSMEDDAEAEPVRNDSRDPSYREPMLSQRGVDPLPYAEEIEAAIKDGTLSQQDYYNMIAGGSLLTHDEE